MNPGTLTSPVRGERLEYAIRRRNEGAPCEYIALELQRQTGEHITYGMIAGALSRAKHTGIAVRPVPGSLRSAEERNHAVRTLLLSVQAAVMQQQQQQRGSKKRDSVSIEWTVLLFSAKWVDSDEVIYVDTGGRGAGAVRDDADLLQRLWGLLDEADIVVVPDGGNIQDVNARLMENGFEEYSPIKLVDLWRTAKKRFDFTFAKLVSMSQKLTAASENGGEQEHEFIGDLEAGCLEDNSEAWALRKRRSVREVRNIEALYLKMRPWLKVGPGADAIGAAADRGAALLRDQTILALTQELAVLHGRIAELEGKAVVPPRPEPAALPNTRLADRLEVSERVPGRCRNAPRRRARETSERSRGRR